jgi:hypothetical protein
VSSANAGVPPRRQVAFELILALVDVEGIHRGAGAFVTAQRSRFCVGAPKEILNKSL